MEKVSCVLIRTPKEEFKDKQTLGTMIIFKGVHKIYETKVLELPWKENQRSVSCIPEGEYFVRKRKAEESPSRNYDHFIVEDVENRSYILWHSGNYHWNIKGCLLHGQSFVDLDGDGLPDVTSTLFTIGHLNKILPDRFRFKIVSL